MAIDAEVAPAPVLSDLLYRDATPEKAPAGSTETEEAAQTVEADEVKTEVSEQSDEQTDNPQSDDEESEEPADYDVTVDGESRKVTRSELIKGYQLESAATKKTMAAAEIKKAAEAKISQADAAIQVLGDIEGEIKSLIMGDVKNIDWDALRESDVSEYLRLKDVVASKEKVLGEMVVKRNQLIQQKTNDEAIALHTALGWSDAAKKQADIDQIMGYMQESGITEQVTSHKLMQTILDAAKYRKLQQSKIEVLKEVKKAPKTTKPTKVAKTAAPKSIEDLMYG